MIDIHTHPCWLTDRDTYDHFERTGKIPAAALEPYFQALEGVDTAVALAFWAPDSQLRVSNDFVAEVVRQDPERIVGFASVDPKLPGAIEELERAIRGLGLQGLKLAPIYQHFVPDDRVYWSLYEKAEEMGLPIMWHQGTSFMVPEGPLEAAPPHRLDVIARTFPRIKMVIAHFGYPWSREVVALVRRHPQVYTDISVLADRPWYLYNALIDALEYGAQDQIVFGSDYPAFTPAETADALRRINDMVAGTSLPKVPEELIESIIARDTLALLGIAS